MNNKNQKVIRGVVIAALAVAFAAFVVMYLTGRVGEISGFTSETPESSATSLPAVSAVIAQGSAVSVVTSVPESVLASEPESEPASVPESVPTSEPESIPAITPASSAESAAIPNDPVIQPTNYKFRSQKLLDQHYEKHGREMGFASAKEYEKAAAAVPNHPDVLHKIEKEDGDDVYYIEATNEFVVVSTDGYIRTYFNPDRGIDYYNKQ